MILSDSIYLKKKFFGYKKIKICETKKYWSGFGHNWRYDSKLETKKYDALLKSLSNFIRTFASGLRYKEQHEQREEYTHAAKENETIASKCCLNERKGHGG